MALTLMLAECISPHLLRAFVYVFRGVNARERRGKKDTGQTAASAEYRNARCMHQRRLSDTCLFYLASENVNKCAQQMRANAIAKHEGQRCWH